MDLIKKVISFLTLGVFLIGGVILYVQQRDIDELRSAVLHQEKQTTEKDSLASNTIPEIKKETPETENGKADLIELQKNAETKLMAGNVLDISHNALKIEADMPDWEKMKKIAVSSELSNEYQNKMAPTIKKIYTVYISGDTKFLKNKLLTIKIGDTVFVELDEDINKSDRMTAIEIIAPYEAPKAQ